MRALQNAFSALSTRGYPHGIFQKTRLLSVFGYIPPDLINTSVIHISVGLMCCSGFTMNKFASGTRRVRMSKDRKNDRGVTGRILLSHLTIFGVIYFVFFVRQFLRPNLVMGGDTQIVWSFNYLALYSLAKFGEFLWWDPTTLNGWPSYVNLTNGWFNYLGPYSIPFQFIYKIGGFIFGGDINTYLVLQKTIYYFLLNLSAIVIMSMLLIRDRIAQYIPSLIFTLSAIVFAGFRDSFLWEAMPAPLFFVASLVYYEQRRSENALLLVIICAGLFAASINYGTLQTSIWWVGGFCTFMLLLRPDLIPTTARLLANLSRAGRYRLAAAAGLVIAGALAFAMPALFNLGTLIRTNGGVIDWSTGTNGGMSFRSAVTLSHPIWTDFLYWLPNASFHDLLLTFDDKGGGSRSGVDQRYIGVFTLPLLIAALLRARRDVMVSVLFLTCFFCVAFVTLSNRNLFVLQFADASRIFENLRTISDTLPRDAPIAFLALLSGMGFDYLLASDDPASGRDEPRVPLTDGLVERNADRLLRILLYALLIGGAGAMLVSVFPVERFSLLVLGHQGSAGLSALREGLTQFGVYLFFSSLLCLVLAYGVGNQQGRRSLAITLVLLSASDLTISATSYWSRGLVWFLNEGPHALPRPLSIGPVDSPVATWPGSNGGMMHNSFAGPYVGLKSWLVLGSRPAWQPVLSNWDSEVRVMRQYPAFRMFTGGRYVHFDAIASIDSLPPPERDNSLYVHDLSFALPDDAPSRVLSGDWSVERFSPNSVRVHVRMPQEGIFVSLDNYDRFWTAKVDGRNAPVFRADFTFKGVTLPAGDHVVAFQYDPWPVKIAYFAFYAVLGFLVASFSPRPRLTLAAIPFIFGLVLLGETLLVWDPSKAYEPSYRFGDQLFRPGQPTLAAQDDNLEIRPSRGATIRVRSCHTSGSLEGVTLDQYGMVSLYGSARDESTGIAASRVLVTVDGRAWILAVPTVSRPDIPAAFSNAAEQYGFAAAGRGVPAAKLSAIRAFALLADGTACELQYGPNVPAGGGGTVVSGAH
jgi:hypothetical protein